MSDEPQVIRDFATSPLTDEENAARIQHVIERLKERASIEATVEEVESAYRRITKSRQLYASGKVPNMIQPFLLWTRAEQHKEHWKVLIKGKPVVLIVCQNRGIVSVERAAFVKHRESAMKRAEKAKKVLLVKTT